MKQLKLNLNLKWMYDVIIQNDYMPSQIVESFETIEAAIKYREYLISRGIERHRIMLQKKNDTIGSKS